MKTTDVEFWRDVVGYEGRYQVSDQGRVRSVDRVEACPTPTGNNSFAWRSHQGRELKPQATSRGYLNVQLCVGGIRKTKSVHVLVAKAFVPGQAETVNHIDGVKTNNTPSNLEWVSQSENLKHAFRTGLRPTIAVRHPKTGREYRSMTEAALAHGCAVSTVGLNFERV